MLDLTQPVTIVINSKKANKLRKIIIAKISVTFYRVKMLIIYGSLNMAK